MSAAPRADVVICAYTLRRWDQLVQAVDSALTQQPAPQQVVVVVDHNDELLERAERIWGGHERVTVVANHRRTGLSGARNTGVSVCTGEVVAFLDDDATARSGWLAALLAPYDDPAVMAVGGAAAPVWPAGRVPDLLPRELWWVVGCTYAGHPTQPGDVRNVLGASMSFRRHIFDVVGGFDELVGRVASAPLGAEETQLCLRLRQQDAGWRVVYQPNAIADHRVSADRVTWQYVLRRSWAEGWSKAAIGRTVGRTRSLSTEWRYTAHTLPRALLRELGHANPVGSASIVASLGSAAAGYLRHSASSWRPRMLAPASTATALAARPAPSYTGPTSLASAGLVDTSSPVVDGVVVDGVVVDGVVDADTLVSVVIPTAGRPAQVERCVRGLLAGSHQALDVVVVDNRPTSPGRDRVLQLGRLDPRVRVIDEPRPGASRARNTGFRHARSPWVLFTDDDVIVDPDWTRAMASELAAPGVHAVTGRVLPWHLGETERLFEQYGGFNKGETRAVFSPQTRADDPLYPYSPGIMGSGNSMGFRREVLDRLGGFDVALGPGTPTRGGEDLDLLLRLALAGGTIIYTPTALAYHEHRAAMDELRSQLLGYGAGLTAVMANLVLDEPVQLWHITRRAGIGIGRLVRSRADRSSALGGGYPWHLVATELAGAFLGPVFLMRSRARQHDRGRRRVPRSGPPAPGLTVEGRAA